MFIESLKGPDPASTIEIRIMNSTSDAETRAPQIKGAASQKCVVCADPIGDQCFCKIPSKEGGPIMLCCPSCVIQYIESARPPANSAEEELRAYEKSSHLFIGDDKPWS